MQFHCHTIYSGPRVRVPGSLSGGQRVVTLDAGAGSRGAGGPPDRRPG